MTASEELAQLLDGVVDRHGVRCEVRHLAAVAATVGQGAHVAGPAPAFRIALRERLLAEAVQPVAAPATALERLGLDLAWRVSAFRRRTRVVVASLAAGSVLTTGSTALAAQTALPGDLLYQVKRSTETVRLVVAGGVAGEGWLNLRFAGERLAELRHAGRALTVDQVVTTLADMDDSTTAGTAALIQEGALHETPAEETRTLVLAFVGEQRQALSQVAGELPEGSHDAVLASLDLLSDLESRTAGDVQPAIAPSTPAPGSSGIPIDSGEAGAAEPDPPSTGLTPIVGSQPTGGGAVPDGAADGLLGDVGEPAGDAPAPAPKPTAPAGGLENSGTPGGGVTAPDPGATVPDTGATGPDPGATVPDPGATAPSPVPSPEATGPQQAAPGDGLPVPPGDIGELDLDGDSQPAGVSDASQIVDDASALVGDLLDGLS